MSNTGIVPQQASCLSDTFTTPNPQYIGLTAYRWAQLINTQRRTDVLIFIMTTHQPRKPYSPEELVQLYPKELELQLVQIVSHPLLLIKDSTKLPKFCPRIMAADCALQLLRHGSPNPAYDNWT